MAANKENLPEPVMPKHPIQKVLKGQKALVTGASSGIGEAVALALGEAGAEVVVNYHSDAAEAERVAEKIRKHDTRAYIHKANVAKEDEVKEMFDEMLRRFGTIDILVNNAGIQKDAPFDEMTLQEWEMVLGVNLTGQFLCSREAVKEFKKRGVKSDASCDAIPPST